MVHGVTLWHLARAIAETARISGPTLIDGLTGRLTPEVCDRRLDAWSRRLLEQAQIELRVQGLNHAPIGEAFVVMSNHQSVYDIPVMFQALQRRVRMVAKKELFKIPGWAQAMRLSGFVELDRRDREKAIASLAHAEQALRNGTSIWIAPEGTRSRDGTLLPFKKGGFHLARATGTRILPVSIDGTRAALSAQGFAVQSGIEVRVSVSPPIDPASYGGDASEAVPERLIADVRDAITAHLP
jgi:1-acyl-sn-glycerol-3-phosphate acyltransferase